MAGPVFFAWVDQGEAFDPVAHARTDEDIFKFDVEQSEGDFATLTAVIRNPRIGLLAPARKVWAWLSWANGATTVPLFFGRLVGLPNDINQELVTLVFTARPADFVARKAAAAEALKVRPFYDPIWISPDLLDDPDTVLEARSALWSIDRVTHAVDITDVLVGEDGLVEFLASEIPYDSVGITIGQTPLRSVSVDASVNWTQQASGTMPFGLTVETYTGKSLIDDWPTPGTSLGGGWSCIASSAVDLNNVDTVETVSYSYNWSNDRSGGHSQGDTMSISQSISQPLLRGPALSTTLTASSQTGFCIPGGPNRDTFTRPAQAEFTYLYVPLWLVKASMTLQYDANRGRKEYARFTLKTDVQSIVTLPDEADVQAIQIDSQDLGLPIDGGGAPIGDLGASSYFVTDRGLWSLEYLIALARATLVVSSRAVQVKFDCKFDRAIALTCRMNARVFDDRLPGHQAVGKIISYKFGIDGSNGLASGTVTIGCAIGYGGAIAEAEGDPTYVAVGYVDTAYQAYTNNVVVLPAGDVGYTVPIDATGDDGLRFPLTRGAVVLTERIDGSADAQADVINTAFAAEQFIAQTTPVTIDEQDTFQQMQTMTVTEVLKTNPVSYSLTLRPVSGMSFETAYDIAVSDLKIPKMIDLEAAS